MKAKPVCALLLLLGGLSGSLVSALGPVALPALPREDGPGGPAHGTASASAQEVPSLGLAQDSSPAATQATDPEHRPVVLVPGWLGRSEELAALRARFLRDGWSEMEVLALEFDDPVGSSLDHGTELEDALRSLLSETGAAKVDIVAHSMGGLAVWSLLQDRGSLLPIRRVVFLASPLQGTVIAHLAWGDGGREMRPGSDFLRRLQEGGEPQRWVEALTIRTPLDFNVVPGYGATLPGLGDRLICCPTHQGLLDHEETYRITRDFLKHGRRGS